MGIILIILGMVLLGAIIYFLFIFNFEEDMRVLKNEPDTGPEQVVGLAETEEDEDKDEENERVIRQISIEKDEDASPASEEEISATELKKMAMSFAERFGSYSTHSDFSNISDLKIFMTDNMKSWADNFIKVGRRGISEDPDYEGVITRAISAEVNDYDLNSETATVSVQAKKTKTSEKSGQSDTSYGKIDIFFKKEKGEWKVDDAEWQ